MPLSSRCPLLELPWEIRELILILALPRTISYRPEVAWNRGSAAILRTSKQLHEEGRVILYGRNTFRIDVIYDCSEFSMLWIQPSRDLHRTLHVKKRRPFPEALKRNVGLIRHLDITVNHVDSYTGMIKYGYGGGGLTEGLKTQVMFLCQTLKRMPVVEKLEICYQCQDYRVIEETQCVLDPFLELKNVKCVTTSGHVLKQTAAKLKEKLPEARKQALDQPHSMTKEDDDTDIKRPPNLETNVKRALAVRRGYDGREI